MLKHTNSLATRNNLIKNSVQSNGSNIKLGSVQQYLAAFQQAFPIGPALVSDRNKKV